MFCRNCGKVLPPDAKICPGCGTMIASTQSSVPAAATTAQGAATATAPAPVASSSPAAAAIGKALGEQVRARSKDAWQGLKLFAVSPVGGLAESYAMFEPPRAMGVGIVFAVIYELLLFLALYRAADKVASGIGVPLPTGDLTFGMAVKLIFIGAVPFITLALAGAIARFIFRGKGSFAGDIYTAGASLLPFGLCLFLASFLGPANFEVIAALSVFALTYTILMLYAGCSRIAGIPETGAAPAVPIMLLLSVWLTKIVVSAVFTF